MSTASTHIAVSAQSAEEYWKKASKAEEMHDWQEVIKYCNLAINVKNSYSTAYFTRAYAKYQLGDCAGALIDNSRGFTLTSEHTWLELMQRLMIQDCLENYTELIDDCNRVIQDQRWNEFGMKKDAYYYRSKAKLHIGDLVGAKIDIKNAIKLVGEDVMVNNNIQSLHSTYSLYYTLSGKISDGLKKYKDAIDEYTQAIKYDKQNFEA